MSPPPPVSIPKRAGRQGNDYHHETSAGAWNELAERSGNSCNPSSKDEPLGHAEATPASSTSDRGKPESAGSFLGAPAAQWLRSMSASYSAESAVDSRDSPRGNMMERLQRSASQRSRHRPARSLSFNLNGGVSGRGKSKPGESRDPLEGAELGPHGNDIRLQQAVAFGGSSTIYRAEWKHPCDQVDTVAVKVMRPDNFAACYAQQELEIWQALPSHPHLLPLMHYEQKIMNKNGSRVEPWHFLVMQLSDAGNLLKFVRQSGDLSSTKPAGVLSPKMGTSRRASMSSTRSHGVSFKVAQDIMQQLASGLYCLHKVAYVVHNDLKLENVLGFASDDKTKSPSWKIADFGLSEKVRMDVPSGGPNARPCGTLYYVAPEVVQSMDLEPFLEDSIPSHDRSTAPRDLPPFARDMWALGCILYALIEGCLPFSDAVQSRLLHRICHGEYDMPNRLLLSEEREASGTGGMNLEESDETRREIRTVLEHLLDIDPDTRWTIDELCQSSWLALY